MSIKTIFLPKEGSIKRTSDDFHWNYGKEPINAQDCSFYYSVFPPTGEKSWVIAGSTGKPVDGNFFAFLISVPYLDEDLMEYTYKLNDGQGLHFGHLHSVPAPPGFEGVTIVDADDAELTLRLDRKAGYVTGEFRALFKSHGYRLLPNGTFKMKRTDSPES
ncbi:hypothetical protein J3P75_18125 [Pseudomonas sp. R1-1]|uniref:hypothetical protein n=1 Tax=Pseudomonas sp. R1-1 TaxID=1602529 RepID=UPI003DA9EF2E